MFKYVLFSGLLIATGASNAMFGFGCCNCLRKRPEQKAVQVSSSRTTLSPIREETGYSPKTNIEKQRLIEDLVRSGMAEPHNTARYVEFLVQLRKEEDSL